MHGKPVLETDLQPSLVICLFPKYSMEVFLYVYTMSIYLSIYLSLFSKFLAIKFDS